MTGGYSYELAFSRNRGFISDDEQAVLRRSHVAIAGAGGDGGLLAIQLARLGVGGFRVADPEVFEIENLNRQAEATIDSVGRNKAQVVSEAIRAISPEADIEVFPDGVTSDNVDRFLAGTNLLVDETEITSPGVALMLARNARARQLPNMTVLNIGFACLATSFVPGGMTLEEILGVTDEGDDVDMSRWLPYVPPYVALTTLEEFATGQRPAPSVAPGVGMAASVGATQAFLHLVASHGASKRPAPVRAPRALVIDALTQKVARLKMSKWTHRRHLLSIAVRDRLSSR